MRVYTYSTPHCAFPTAASWQQAQTFSIKRMLHLLIYICVRAGASGIELHFFLCVCVHTQSTQIVFVAPPCILDLMKRARTGGSSASSRQRCLSRLRKYIQFLAIQRERKQGMSLCVRVCVCFFCALKHMQLIEISCLFTECTSQFFGCWALEGSCGPCCLMNGNGVDCAGCF